MLLSRFAIFALALGSTAAIAEPAPWYWWVSSVDGSRFCHQTPLGAGWLQEPKPFKDARCRIPLYRP